MLLEAVYCDRYMDDHKAYNDKLFSRWAPIYDGFELLLSGIREQIVQEIDPVNLSVLDVATGTGSLAIELSPVAKKVVGIDLSVEMLAVAKSKKHTGDLTFLEMDASKMDLEDDHFDVVTISLGLHDMPPEIRTAVLQETKRVLKPDGKLYILEYDLPNNKLMRSITPQLINSFESRYYLDFLKVDLQEYLRSFGFKVDGKTNFLLGHLQLLQLSPIE